MGTVRLTEKRKDTYVRRAEEMFQKANDFPEFTPEETTKIMVRLPTTRCNKRLVSSSTSNTRCTTSTNGIAV